MGVEPAVSGCPRCVAREHDRPALTDMLMSGVAWLGRLGELRASVLDGDFETARKLAAQPIRYPERFPEDAANSAASAPRP